MKMQKHHLDAYDAHLAEYRPFGDSDYLHEQLQIRYKHRLEKLSAYLRVAGELSRALDQAEPHARYRTVGDPVVRHTIQQALRRVMKGAQDGMLLAECEDVFRETLRLLQEGRCCGPLESDLDEVSRLGPEPHHGWIWSEEHRDDEFGRLFRKIIRDNFPSERSCTASAEDVARLANGAKLLGALLPRSSRSALSHVHVIIPFEGQKASCSEFRVGGAICMNRELLHNPWWVAEHLLHESLHQKLYDFRHTHSLLARDLSPQLSASPESAPIYSIWNAGGADRSNHWDTFRGIAAFHVYVHLALFCLQAERRKAELADQFGAPEGPLPALIHWHEAFERAQCLGRQLKESAWQEIGPAGRQLIDWLTSILTAIDAAPPPADSVYLHLLLERYLIEATTIASKKLSPELTTELRKLSQEEAETVRRVLTAVDAAPPDLDRLDEAALRRSDEGAEAAFFRFRNHVAKTLQTLSPDGYGLRRPSTGDSTSLGQSVQTMVEKSSQQLIHLLEGEH
jgi:hypothetical protein